MGPRLDPIFVFLQSLSSSCEGLIAPLTPPPHYHSLLPDKMTQYPGELRVCSFLVSCLRFCLKNALCHFRPPSVFQGVRTWVINYRILLPWRSDCLCLIFPNTIKIPPSLFPVGFWEVESLGSYCNHNFADILNRWFCNKKQFLLTTPFVTHFLLSSRSLSHFWIPYIIN